MKIAPYKREHLDAILDELRDEELCNVSPAAKDREEVLKSMEYYEERAVIVTFMDDDHPVAIFVGMRLWAGVAELWALVGTRADSTIVGFQRACARGLKNFIDCHKDEPLHRIQAVVHSDHYRSRKWLQWMGFSEEGVLKKFGPDKADYLMVAREV